MTIKDWLSKVKQNAKKVKFPKPRKSNVEVKPRKISQRAANRLLLGFVGGMVFLSALTIVSNAVRSMSMRTTKPVLQVEEKSTRAYSNEINLFMTNFLNAYFSENSAESKTRLSEFYGGGLEVKNSQTSNADSQLTAATLVEVTENLATYRVNYSVKVGEDWRENAGLLNIPYGEKDGKFYVSDLPYFTNEGSYTAKNVKAGIRLKEQDGKDFEKAEEYVEAFFKAYVSGDKTQMSPFSKTVQPINGYLLGSLDYTYFIQDEKDKTKLVAVVQITLTDAFELSHQENFVLSLKADKENDSYRVLKLEHGIPEKYRKQMK